MSDQKNFLIVVAGLPCTGKTTISEYISENLSIPLISKDDIREILFDNFPYKNEGFYDRISASNYELIYFFVRSVISRKGSIILESVFHAKALERIEREVLSLLEMYRFHILQIQLALA